MRLLPILALVPAAAAYAAPPAPLALQLAAAGKRAEPVAMPGIPAADFVMMDAVVYRAPGGLPCGDARP